MRVICKRVAMIGGGPSGLAAAKYFAAEKAFDVIDVYEQRSEAGGLWIHTSNLTHDDLLTVPQTNPFGYLEKPFWRRKGDVDTNNAIANGDKITLDEHEKFEPEFLSPVYDMLETNIPRQLMQYSDHPFPESTQLFPTHGDVAEYLISYSADVRHLIKFSTQVTNIRLARPQEADINGTTPERNSPSCWVVTSKFLETNQESQSSYDAIILANGHYTTPHVPQIPGISEWEQAFPNSITHARYYRRPDVYANKKVIVVGNSASGMDIGRQIAQHCSVPLLMSCKSANPLARGFLDLSKKLDVPPITSFDAASKTVHFADGRAEKDVDAIVFCTGYFYSFPFLPSSLVQHPDFPLVTTGVRVCSTYKHLFYAPHPSLALMTVPQKIIPFPLAEVQAAVLARVYSGRLALPELEDMLRWENEMLSKLGQKGERDFHTLTFPKDAEYINDLCDWAASADLSTEVVGGERKHAATENEENREERRGIGKMAQRWGAWHYWARERFPLIMRAFAELGPKRCKAKTLEDVGFDFEAYLAEKRDEAKAL